MKRLENILMVLVFACALLGGVWSGMSVISAGMILVLALISMFGRESQETEAKIVAEELEGEFERHAA